MTDDRFERTGKYFSDRSFLLDNIKRLGGYNSISSANAANLYGMNHRGMPLATARNTDHYGYTFFTRPDLRLSYDNLVRDRNFALMNTREEMSIWRWVRSILDPRGSMALVGTNADALAYNSPFVDKTNAFIPILTNNLETISGWSEIVVDPTTSEAGYYNEQVSIADGFAFDYSSRTMSATFKNQIQDPLNRLFHVWTRYSMLVHEGEMDPYLSNIVMNIVDYNTRIYRFVMDPTKQYIQHVAACGAAFPLNSNLSAKFDFTKEKPYSEENDSVTINFQVMGSMYDDPILFWEFNQVVAAFAPFMNDNYRATRYKEITGPYLKAFNCMGLPWVDLDTGRLTWWVTNQEYQFILNQIGSIDSELDKLILERENNLNSSSAIRARQQSNSRVRT